MIVVLFDEGMSYYGTQCTHTVYAILLYNYPKAEFGHCLASPPSPHHSLLTPFEVNIISTIMLFKLKSMTKKV